MNVAGKHPIGWKRPDRVWERHQKIAALWLANHSARAIANRLGVSFSLVTYHGNAKCQCERMAA